VRIVDMVDTFRDLLSGALDAYLAMASNRMNAVMKTLTSASIILLVPTLIAGVYGMNFENMPELHSRYGYYIALGIMGAAIAGLTIYFKRKQWL
jgi:magnesium transporter